MTPVPQVVRGVLRSALMPAFMAWERVESGVSYNPISAKTIAYPFDKYEELRQKDPVHRLRTINAWVLTEYEHANAVLQGPRALLPRLRRERARTGRCSTLTLPITRG